MNLSRCGLQSDGYEQTITDKHPLFIQTKPRAEKRYRINVLLVVAERICTIECVSAIRARIAVLDQQEREAAVEQARAAVEQAHVDADLDEALQRRAFNRAAFEAAMARLAEQRTQTGLPSVDRARLLTRGEQLFGDRLALEDATNLGVVARVCDLDDEHAAVVAAHRAGMAKLHSVVALVHPLPARPTPQQYEAGLDTVAAHLTKLDDAQKQAAELRACVRSVCALEAELPDNATPAQYVAGLAAVQRRHTTLQQTESAVADMGHALDVVAATSADVPGAVVLKHRQVDGERKKVVGAANAVAGVLRVPLYGTMDTAQWHGLLKSSAGTAVASRAALVRLQPPATLNDDTAVVWCGQLAAEPAFRGMGAHVHMRMQQAVAIAKRIDETPNPADAVLDIGAAMAPKHRVELEVAQRDVGACKRARANCDGQRTVESFYESVMPLAERVSPEMPSELLQHLAQSSVFDNVTALMIPKRVAPGSDASKSSVGRVFGLAMQDTRSYTQVYGMDAGVDLYVAMTGICGAYWRDVTRWVIYATAKKKNKKKIRRSPQTMQWELQAVLKIAHDVHKSRTTWSNLAFGIQMVYMERAIMHMQSVGRPASTQAVLLWSMIRALGPNVDRMYYHRLVNHQLVSVYSDQLRPKELLRALGVPEVLLSAPPSDRAKGGLAM